MILARNLKWSKYYFQLLVPRCFQNANLSTLYMSTNAEENTFYKHIVWLDMEMTGLDVCNSHVLELACVITNKDLEVISKDLNIVIHQPNEILNNMNEWSLKTHARTGLINESRLSKITVEDAEQILLKYLKTYVNEGTCPIAGSSVYVDRMFLYKYMPSINSYLHYRIIDTSTIKELIKRWCMNVPAVEKAHSHRALQDIKESIQELKHYKKYIFDLCIKN